MLFLIACTDLSIRTIQDPIFIEGSSVWPIAPSSLFFCKQEPALLEAQFNTAYQQTTGRTFVQKCKDGGKCKKWHIFTKGFPKEGFAGYSTHSKITINVCSEIDPYNALDFFLFSMGAKQTNPKEKRSLNTKDIQKEQGTAGTSGTSLISYCRYPIRQSSP